MKPEDVRAELLSKTNELVRMDKLSWVVALNVATVILIQRIKKQHRNRDEQ